MHSPLTRCHGSLLPAAGCLAALFHLAPAAAGPVSFSAQVSGLSDIVGVLDPSGPVVQIQTAASGPGSLGALQYFSADVVNLATGQGAGQNRFVAGDGAELFGRFTVQLQSTADPAVLQLLGVVDFTGGSQRFAGATGSASFTGLGRFISPSQAVSHFDYNGRVVLVPEPSTAALLLAALAAAGIRQHRRHAAGAADPPVAWAAQQPGDTACTLLPKPTAPSTRPRC